MKPLQGVTVLDISRLLPGGFASLLLGDLGARVVKIEQPGVGDYYRALKWGVSNDDPPSPPLSRTGQAGSSLANVLGDQADVINQGKESLALDLKNPEGREVFLKLVRKADVVLENFRPGVLKKLALDYPRLRKISPRVILCSVTGLGQKGRDATLAGHDVNYLGLSGLLARNRDANGAMVIPDFQMIDLAAGYDAALKIAAALQQRRRTKKGSWIDVSMVGSGLAMSRLYARKSAGTGSERKSKAAGGLVRYGVYETADGRFLTLAALEPKFWRNFCRAVGRPEWSHVAETYEFLGEDARRELQGMFKRKPLAEWIELGRNHDLCLFPVEDIPDWARAVRRPTPKLGEHSVRILRKMGYSPKQIAALRAKGVVA